MHCNPYIIVNKCHISRSQHDPKHSGNVSRECNSSPPRKHPVIINDMIDRNAKTPSSSSVKRIYKLGHKYRSKSCENRTESQYKLGETLSVANNHETEERCNSRPSSAKHFITRRRNYVNPSYTTSTAEQNFSQTHVDNVEKKDRKCKSPNDAELKNGDRKYTSETVTTNLYGQTDTCKNKSGTSIYTNRLDRRRRNCVSPAETNRANSRERKCTTPQSTTNQNSPLNSYTPNKTERICRRSSPARYADQKRNCRSPCVSPVNVDRQKSSPVKCQDKQKHHIKSQIPLGDVERHCINPFPAEYNEKSRQDCRSLPNMNGFDQPNGDCWSPVSNKNQYCKAQSCNNPHCGNYSTDYLVNNCISPYNDTLERDYRNQYCTDNHIKQVTRNCGSPEYQDTLLDQNHNFDCNARVCGSNSSPIQSDNSVQQLTNTANYSTSTRCCPSSKDINNTAQSAKTSSCDRYHHDKYHNNQKSTTCYDRNEINTNGRSSPTTTYNNEQRQPCQSEIDNRDNFDKHFNSSASTNNNANVQNKTSRRSSCDEICDIIGQDDRNPPRGNRYDDTDRTCQNATGSSNGENIERYCISPHNFNNYVKDEPSNEDQRCRSQSCIPHYDTSDQNSKTATENPDCDREMNIKSPKSDKELNNLEKKCRSISSANQERRRWGTPLTLILYVKKKCQNKIRKIMASKNHVAASKTLDSEVLDNDERVNKNNVLPEVDKTSQETQNGEGCDANGNNIYRNTVRKNSKPEKNKDIPDTGDPKQTEVRKKQLTEEEMVRLESFSRLDPSTLHVIGWSSGATDSMSSTQNLTETQEDENMCKLSRVEFKRLQEQVRDVSFNLRNRFRTSAYQKLYQQPHPTPLENATQLYRTQLAASLRAFKPKDWPPLNTQELETSYLRCKPINCQNDSNSSQSTRCSAKVRPKSVPPSAFRNRTQQKRSETPTDVRPGNFDSLNPRVLSHLLSDNISSTSYGEIPKNLIKPERSDSPPKPKDDDVSTSGIESTPTDDTSSSDDEDDSDYEPEVDENRLAPDLYLRPEKLDSLVLPDSAKGWRKFDFDADNVHFPIYAFANPLPDPFEDLDLRQIARLKWNWRDQTRHRTREKGVDDLLDRMVELERLQIETEDWEQKRTAQINKRVSKRAASARYPRDKRCCGKCLQPACTGDCPEKNVQSEVCELCRQPFCIKTCSDTKYDQRMRQSRSDDKMTVQRSANPKYCRSCQTKHNAKFINANNIVLGRPKSCNTTYSRGQASNKPKDYRPRSDTPVSIDLFQEFDKLGIDAQQPVRPTTAKIQRPRSRNSSFPGKSFYSQRRDSLTEADKNRFKKKVQKNSKVLVRRPKTAV